MTTVYGIPNCDTVKKARAWLLEANVPYAFHDYKKSGIERATLELWLQQVRWEELLNRGGTTFRKLPEADKVLLDRDRAAALMLANPSMIKRPVVVTESTLLVGFSPDRWREVFG